MSSGLRCLSVTKLKQLKRRKSSGSLNTGVPTKKNERSGDNLKRFNIHMGMKMTKSLLYPHPPDLLEKSSVTAPTTKNKGGSVAGMPIVSASKDSKVGGEG